MVTESTPSAQVELSTTGKLAQSTEVVVMGRDFPCPTAPVVESSTCADGVLSVTMSYETDWCYCDTMSSVPIAVIARKGLITDIDGAWVDRSVCEDTTCDCGGSVVSGCQGCPAP